MLACLHELIILFSMASFQNFGDLVEGQPIAMNTFVGHSWSVRVGDRTVATWDITSSEPNQRFILRPKDVPEDLRR